MDDPATPELIDRWMKGDADAAEQIYTRYIDRVKKVALKWTHDTVAAEEVAAETMAQILAQTREGKQIDYFTRFLVRVTRNLSAMRHRAGKKESPLKTASIEALGAGPATVNIRGEMADILNKAIASLPPSCREVIEPFSQENLDRGQIAERLGIPRDTVDKRLQRAHEALRDAIEKHMTSLIVEPMTVTWEDVQSLRPSFRTAFSVRHLEGCSVEEAAARLDVPVETVEARLAKAYVQLGCGPEGDFQLAREGYRRSL